MLSSLRMYEESCDDSDDWSPLYDGRFSAFDDRFSVFDEPDEFSVPL